MNQVTTTVPAPSGLTALIDKLLSHDVDLDKVDRVIEMQRDWEMREAEKAFAEAHAAAEAEMHTVTTDANNPQTKSNYATLAQVDRIARPIYTKFGFSISFTTEQSGTPGEIMVVGTLSHRLGASRRYQIPVPIVTRGIQGREMMNATHATMSAISYGRRNIVLMMFNLAVGDDDGNAAGRRQPPKPAERPINRPAQAQAQPTETIDPETGEVTETATEPVPPKKIYFQGDWRDYGTKLVAGLRTAQDIETVDSWLTMNHDPLEQMQREKPALFETLRAGIENVKLKFLGGSNAVHSDQA